MRKALLLMLVLGMFACKKNKPVPPPTKAVLSFPNNNEACTIGTIISSTQSSIIFKWNASENTESYELSIKNLESGFSATQTTTQTELEVTLNRNTPYSWYIVSKSSKVSDSAQSDTWKFYNSGSGTVSYAPFLAEILAPASSQNITAASGKITLDWNGSDVDGDISSYDVYFGTTTSPALFKSNLTESILNDVSVTSNTTYYWKVITKDSKGNSSDSGVCQFKVN